MSKEYKHAMSEGTSALDLYSVSFQTKNIMPHVHKLEPINAVFPEERGRNDALSICSFIIDEITFLGKSFNRITLENISGKPFNRMTTGQAIGAGTLFTIAAIATVFFGI